MASTSSRSATATSAPLFFQLSPLLASRTTTRTGLPCERSVSAATFPVFPVTPAMTNMVCASVTGEHAHSVIMCTIDVAHVDYAHYSSPLVRPESAPRARCASGRAERHTGGSEDERHTERHEPLAGASPKRAGRRAP